VHNPDTPILDLTHALEAMDNDHVMYGEILSMYLTTTMSLFTEMKEQLQINDIVALKRGVHTLKSSSRTIGAMNLGSHSERLEHTILTLSPAEISTAISHLKSQFIKLCATLSAEGFPVPLQK